MTRASRRLLLGAAIAVGSTAPVYADPTYTPAVTITGGAGYSTNPFLVLRDNADAASINVDITPTLDIVDGPSRATVTGNYNRQEYLSKFGGNEGYGLSLTGGSQLNARTSFNVSSGFTSSVLGSGGIYNYPAVSTPGTVAPGTLPPFSIDPVTGAVIPISGDVGLIGLRQRRNELSVGGSVTYLPSARSTWTFGLNGSRTTYPNDERFNDIFISNYRNYGGNISYSRSLSETQSVGFEVTVNQVDYADRPNSRVYVPRLTYTNQLSPLWTLNAAIGAGITDEQRTRTTVSFEATLCRQTERGQLCFSGSRQPSITGISGVRTQTAASVSYTQPISELTTVSAGVSYTHIGNSLSRVPGVLALDDQSYLSGDVTVNRQVSQRLSLFASGSYRDVYGLGPGVNADIGGRLGVRWVVGRRQ